MPASNALAIRKNGEAVAKGTIRTEGVSAPGTTIATPVLEVAEGDIFELAAWVGESFATSPEACFLAIEVVEATGLTTTLRDLGDTDLLTTAPAAGDALIWDAGSGKWMPGRLPDPANIALTGGTIDGVAIGGTTFNTTSDARLKSDRQDFDPGPILDAIPVHDFAMFGRRRRGFSSAQAMQVVFPEAVTPGEGNPGEPDFVPWSIDPSALVPLLVREVQQLRVRIAALEAGQDPTP